MENISITANNEALQDHPPSFQSIFREYDLRGRVIPGELDEAAVLTITRAFSVFLQARLVDKVVVGCDNRKISPVFAKIACAELARVGFQVYDLGMTITPAAYFAQYHLEAPGLMMITASHNPDGWCGCKLGHDYSTTLGTEDIKELYTLATEGASINYPIAPGEIISYDIRSSYIQDIVNRVQMSRTMQPLRVVVDAGNGAAGIYAWELFQRLGCLTFQLNCDPDDNYPHYFPNPSELKARQRLQEMVLHPGIKGDIGISFDGDGDRLGVIDGGGRNVWSDRLLMLLAKAVLDKAPGAKVVFDVKCTQALPETIIAHGGTPIMWKTGHSHIKQKLKEENAALAGERSGHIFMAHGGYGYDDAMLAAANLCKIMTEQERPLRDILADYPYYITSPEIKISCPDAEKYEITERLQNHFVSLYGSQLVNTINGARVSYPEEQGWALVRASSNLPELVIVLESKTQDGLMAIKDKFKAELAKFGISNHWENDN